MWRDLSARRNWPLLYIFHCGWSTWRQVLKFGINTRPQFNYLLSVVYLTVMKCRWPFHSFNFALIHSDGRLMQSADPCEMVLKISRWTSGHPRDGEVLDTVGRLLNPLVGIGFLFVCGGANGKTIWARCYFLVSCPFFVLPFPTWNFRSIPCGTAEKVEVKMMAIVWDLVDYRPVILKKKWNFYDKNRWPSTCFLFDSDVYSPEFFIVTNLARRN